MFGLSVYQWAEVAGFSVVLWALHWYVRGLRKQIERLHETAKRNAAEAKHWHKQALEAGSRCKALEKRCEELQTEREAEREYLQRLSSRSVGS